MTTKIQFSINFIKARLNKSIKQTYKRTIINNQVRSSLIYAQYMLNLADRHGTLYKIFDNLHSHLIIIIILSLPQKKYKKQHILLFHTQKILEIILKSQQQYHMFIRSNHLYKRQPHMPIPVKVNEFYQLPDWKVSVRTHKQKQKKNQGIFDTIAFENQANTIFNKNQIWEHHARSSYQIYKRKQKLDRQKLMQFHSIQTPKSSNTQFISTLRSKQSRSSRRTHILNNNNNEIHNSQLNLSPTKIQIHHRSLDYNNDHRNSISSTNRNSAIKTTRECVSQNINRKCALPRKFSLDHNSLTFSSNNSNSNGNKFKIRKSNSYGNTNTNINGNWVCYDFNNQNLPYRPWSPGDVLDHQHISQVQHIGL